MRLQISYLIIIILLVTEVTLAPVSMSLSEAMAKGSALKCALIFFCKVYTHNFNFTQLQGSLNLVKP